MTDFKKFGKRTQSNRKSVEQIVREEQERMDAKLIERRDKLIAKLKESDNEYNTKEEAEAKAYEESIPREHKSALKRAESYAEFMSMSKASVYDQLTYPYGDKYPADAAQYAIDNIEFDWKENAVIKARFYADIRDMSDSAIYDRLISEYGGKFTPDEAQHGIDNLY
ncbi:Ltp family lipoprotein [Sporosarcina sp. D27]|uniref:Ltp family lipoprotein n=1 Tax=Sporosarcina sp. D27 TaxID=1382305 RepID=UPI00047146D5|nr:Ltp family lipoprotein [Sporosarcina sp. D27]